MKIETLFNHFSSDYAWINKSRGTVLAFKRRSSIWWQKDTKVNHTAYILGGKKEIKSSNP